MSPVKIELTPYDPAWRTTYRREAEAILSAMPGAIIEIHHVGSTAVPGLVAKPVIDILVSVWRLEQVDDQINSLGDLGYTNKGEYGIEGRRYLTKGTAERDSFHVHVFQAAHSELSRHVVFRDYLIAHPEAAEAYAALKRGLAQSEWNSTSDYSEAKTEFIRQTFSLADEWRRGGMKALG